MKLLGKLKIKSSNEVEDSYVSIGFECLDRELWKPEKCYDLLSASGIKYARCQTGWAKCEKKGVYDFSWLDEVVDKLISLGVKPWFNVGFGNPIYMPDAPNPTAVGCVPLFYGEEVYSAWLAYTKALAEHFRGRVAHFEIWNEPDIDHFWYPEKPNPKKYAILVKDTGSVIKSIIPDAKIGAVMSVSAKFNYMSSLCASLSRTDIDFFSIHIYTTVPEFRYSQSIEVLKKLLAENGMGDVEIWQGEGGYPSWAYKGHWLLKDGADGERAQAVCQLRRYFIDVALGIKLSSFFSMADLWEKPYEKAVEVIHKAAATGILNGLTYTPKKSYETISNLSSLLTKDVVPDKFFAVVDFAAQNVCEFISTQVMTYKKGEYSMCAYYIPTDVASENENSYGVTVDMYGENIEDPILIDMYTGDVFEIKSEIISTGCTSFKDLPIKDYPLVITDRSVISID